MEIGVALGILATYLMVLVRVELPEERTHLIEYGVVAVFIHEALKERSNRGRRVPAPAMFAVGATALIGLLDEGVQVRRAHTVSASAAISTSVRSSFIGGRLPPHSAWAPA